MLHTPDDFLSAIEAVPADRTRRLVFADWLDEHDDSCGELIRVEEEMRELPVFSDRFWELKPRRNALRVQAGPEWCGRMRYGTECEPVFRHGIPEGWRERWRLIREFTERWEKIPMGDVGGRQAEVKEAEAGLGRKLPPSVREWFVTAKELRNLGILPNVLGDFELRGFLQRGVIAITGFVEFRSIVQFIGISDSDLDNPDPPLHYFGIRSPGASNLNDNGLCAERVTDYLLQQWLPETVTRFNCFSIRDAEIPRHLLDELKNTFPPPTIVGGEDYGLELYEADDILVQRAYYVWVMVSKQLPREQVPPVLRELAKLDPRGHEIFAPENP